MKYSRIITAILGNCWAMQPGKTAGHGRNTEFPH